MTTFIPFIVFLSQTLLQTLCLKEFQPYGPKMCNLYCQRNNCSEYIFDDLQLRCLLTSINTSQLYPKTSNENNTEAYCTGMTKKAPASRQPYKNKSIRTGNICPPAEVKKFFHFCDIGSLVEVRRLVCQGIVDVNCHFEKEKSTAVMITAFKNNTEIFDFLVRQNCDLSDADTLNDTVIHHACAGNSVYIVKKLLDDHNVSIEERGSYGRTPLMEAIAPGHMEVFKFLIKRGADVKSVDYSGNTILHLALRCVRQDFIDLIMSWNIIDIESRGEMGQTPLMVAVSTGSISNVEKLRNKGAKETVIDDKGCNVFHIACGTGNLEMVKHLASLGSLKEAEKGREITGLTPLAIARRYEFTSIVKFLTQDQDGRQ